MSANANWTRLTLRIVGTLDLLAWLALFLSREEMSAIHAGLGMGELPAAPVVGYLARTAAVQYGLHGILLWAISGDVARYSPLIRWLVILKLIQAGAIFVVDWAEGMPLWWTIVEPACLAFAGAALAQARRWDLAPVERSRKKTSTEPDDVDPDDADVSENDFAAYGAAKKR